MKNVFKDPEFAARLHAIAAVAWLGPGSVISYVLRDSIAFLVFLSVYAVVAAHWSAYQGAKSENSGKDN